MKERITLIALTLALIASLTWNFRQQSERSEKDQRITELIALGGKAETVRQYVRDSITHTVFKDVYVKDNTAEKHLAVTKTYADSLERALRISIDKMNEINRVNGKLTAQIKLAETSSGDKQFADKWLQLRYSPSLDSLWLRYDVSLNMVRYDERKYFWNAKNRYVHIYSDDPRVTIHGLKTFRIEHPKPRPFGLGVQAGYGWHIASGNLRPSPYIGVGLQYDLINF
ncbi:MAG: hypothetical protein Q4G08_04190 [Capnocytophaga sp.]|nr:hypothetical protein [Capnocytophaga sp.]